MEKRCSEGTIYNSFILQCDAQTDMPVINSGCFPLVIKSL